MAPCGSRSLGQHFTGAFVNKTNLGTASNVSIESVEHPGKCLQSQGGSAVLLVSCDKNEHQRWFVDQHESFIHPQSTGTTKPNTGTHALSIAEPISKQEVYAGILADGSVAVVFFNAEHNNETSHNISVEISKLPGAGSSVCVSARDLVKRQDMGVHCGSIGMIVEPHGAQMLRLNFTRALPASSSLTATVAPQRRGTASFKSDDAAVQGGAAVHSHLQPFGRRLWGEWMFATNFSQMNHGAYGATPRPVMEAQWKYMQQMEANMQVWMNGLPGDDPELPCFPGEEESCRNHGYKGIVAAARARLAKYLNASAEDLVLVDNASNGINMLLRSFVGHSLKRGDVLLDFSVVYGPFADFYRWLMGTVGVEVYQVQIGWPLTSPTQVVSAFRKVLDEQRAAGKHVAYAVVSHVSSYPCVLLPVAELTAASHEYGVPMIVDGAHALGNLPVDLGLMQNVDFWFGNAVRRRLPHQALSTAFHFFAQLSLRFHCLVSVANR